jgi:hypothetical protein
LQASEWNLEKQDSKVRSEINKDCRSKRWNGWNSQASLYSIGSVNEEKKATVCIKIHVFIWYMCIVESKQERS